MKTGIQQIEDERLRQVEAEGYTSEHDDRYVNDELKRAGACYEGIGASGEYDPNVSPPADWPWAPEWWKPQGGAIRCLVKAGALYLAEMHRLERMCGKRPPLAYIWMRARVSRCARRIDELQGSVK
jgi:hypothetical protein